MFLFMRILIFKYDDDDEIFKKEENNFIKIKKRKNLLFKKNVKKNA